MLLERFTCTGRHPSLSEAKACPLCSRRQVLWAIQQKIQTTAFTGSTPSVFVGRAGYPQVQVGFMSLPDEQQNAWQYDAPSYWAKENFDNAQVLAMRSSLIHAYFKATVRASQRSLDLAKLAGKAPDPVSLSIELDQKPVFSFDFDKVTSPMGPRAMLRQVKETQNISLPVHVEKVDADTDMSAADAIAYLQKHQYNETYIARLLSLGVMGRGTERKLVPTRWSITATDDMLAKHLLESVKTYSFAEHTSYIGTYMGNTYVIFFFPEPWSFELFEAYMPLPSSTGGQAPSSQASVSFTSDYEGFYGRTVYAYNCAGGYYSVRLAVAEALKAMKRQASVFALRIIAPDYKVPLGVWVTREASRKALAQKPVGFASKELMVQFLKAYVKKHFGFDVSPILSASKLLGARQKTLTEF